MNGSDPANEENPMTTSTLGLISGLLLSIAVIIGGLTGFLLAVVLGVGGYVVGGQIDGEFDLGALLRGRRG